jgi:hypothetical protein
MPVELMWDDEAHTILIQKYTGELIPEEFQKTVDQSRQMLLSVSHPVDLIIDAREVENKISTVMNSAKYADDNVPQNQRYLVVVGANLVIRSLVNAASKFAPKATKNIFFVNTVSEARHKLIEYRETHLREAF